MTSFLGKEYVFKDSHSRLNELVNTIIRVKVGRRGLFSKYANDEFVTKGFQRRQELAAEERQSLENRFAGIFFSDLCSGLFRLSNLQSVKIDNVMWDGNQVSSTSILVLPYYTLDTIFVGSPLARSWCSWHLRPRRSADLGFERLSLMLEALSRTRLLTQKRSLTEDLSTLRYGKYIPPEHGQCF